MKTFNVPLILIISISILTHCVPVSTSQNTVNKRIFYDDYNYEPIVGSVQIAPNQGYSSSSGASLISNRIISKYTSGIYLTFDLFQENYEPLQVKFIHCNFDWTPSGLSAIRFLKAYNGFEINDYQYSANTRRDYVRYEINLPTPQITGNYIIALYQNNNPDDVIFTRKICVVSNQFNIESVLKISSLINKRGNNQEINFKVSHPDELTINYLNDIKTCILQNQNWKISNTSLVPNTFNSETNTMNYDYFTGENNFNGWNEFRFFDLRTIDFRGMNMAHIEKSDTKIDGWLGLDKPRTGIAYSGLINDLNGNYYLKNNDPNDSEMQSEYVNVHFELQSEKIDGYVYICGRFNDWQLNANNIMRYNEERKSYTGTALLKQGYYDYMYWVDSPTLPFDLLEGSHFQTRNQYDILIYYRNPINQYDEIVGHQSISSNL